MDVNPVGRRPRHAEDARAVWCILGSGLFDADYYRAQVVDAVLTRDAAAALHFHRTGWTRLCDPSPKFSTVDYLSQHVDVAAAGIDPLVHYLHYGRAEGRVVRAAPILPRAPTRRAQAQAPEDAAWTELARRLQAGAPRLAHVDVIVPVFKGAAETLRCLYSVLDATPSTPFRLVVIDDHAPDAAIVARLKWLAARDLVELVRTPQNGGFVRACNLGLSLHPTRDVVLLNADTEVFGDWLDRLVAAALGDPEIGTVTPFSNNAEICSYPSICTDNPFHTELSDRELDALMARENAGGLVDIPTGVGFCMYVRRSCLAAIGPLDSETFGAGYGEENDFCRRASEDGWRNVLAADVFVRHYGGSSFGASKTARIERAIAAVERKHPGYLATIARFIAADPIAAWRARVDAARIKGRVAGRSAMLFIGHNRGGGTDRHIEEMAALLETCGTPVVLGRPDPAGGDRLRLSDRSLRFQPNAPTFDLADDPRHLAAAFAALGIGHVHVHHLVGFVETVADHLRLACGLAGIAYDFTAHDYLAVCPRITLTDEQGLYCGEPDADGCQSCLRRRGSDFGVPAIWAWRERYGRFLRGARHVYVPAADVALRLARYFEDVDVVVRPHVGGSPRPRATAPARRSTPGRHVGLVGAIGPHKGSAFLLRCVERAAARRLPLRFTLIGYTDRDAAFAACGNMTVEGAYVDADLGDRVAALAPDLLWFPALWPETFSYTLSTAFEAGIPPVAFDFGAIAERIRRTGFGRLLPVDHMFDADLTLDALLALDLATCIPPPPDAPVVYRAPLHSYYGLLPPARSDRPLRSTA